MDRRKKDVWQIISENWIWVVTMIFCIGGLWTAYQYNCKRIDGHDEDIKKLSEKTQLIMQINTKVDYVISDLAEIRSDIRAIRSSERLSDIPIRSTNNEIAGIKYVGQNNN